MKYIHDSIPFLTMLRIGLVYGWANRKATWAMYSSILRKARTDWEKIDWRAELRSVMFSFGNSPFKDTSWKAMKKMGMSWKRWRLLSAPEVPVERPDKWGKAEKNHAIYWAILPECYLRRFSDFMPGCKLGKYFDKLVKDVREKSFEELNIEWSIAKPDVNPEDLACLLFMGWCSQTAWAWIRRRHNIVAAAFLPPSRPFEDMEFGDDFFMKMSLLVRDSDAFDAALGEKFLQALSACVMWYARPHAVTGMFSILEQQKFKGKHYNAPRTVFGAKFELFVMSLNSRFNPFAKSNSLMVDEARALPGTFREIISLKRKDTDR